MLPSPSNTAATTSPSVGSATSTVGCIASPCSLWDSASSVASALSPPTEIERRRLMIVRASPSVTVTIEYLSWSEWPKVLRSARNDRPPAHPVGTSGASAAAAPPSNGVTTKRPTSEPASSSNHATPEPSGTGVPVRTPVGWSVSWVCRSVRRSHDQSWRMPEALVE